MSRQLSEAKRYQLKNQAGDWAFISVTTPVSVQQMRDLIGLSNTLLGVGNKPTDDKPQATPESTERA